LAVCTLNSWIASGAGMAVPTSSPSFAGGVLREVVGVDAVELDVVRGCLGAVGGNILRSPAKLRGIRQSHNHARRKPENLGIVSVGQRQCLDRFLLHGASQCRAFQLRPSPRRLPPARWRSSLQPSALHSRNLSRSPSRNRLRRRARQIPQPSPSPCSFPAAAAARERRLPPW
jgi:hypothetical protein